MIDRPDASATTATPGTLLTPHCRARLPPPPEHRLPSPDAVASTDKGLASSTWISNSACRAASRALFPDSWIAMLHCTGGALANQRRSGADLVCAAAGGNSQPHPYPGDTFQVPTPLCKCKCVVLPVSLASFPACASTMLLVQLALACCHELAACLLLAQSYAAVMQMLPKLRHHFACR